MICGSHCQHTNYPRFSEFWITSSRKDQPGKSRRRVWDHSYSVHPGPAMIVSKYGELQRLGCDDSMIRLPSRMLSHCVHLVLDSQPEWLGQYPMLAGTTASHCLSTGRRIGSFKVSLGNHRAAVSSCPAVKLCNYFRATEALRVRFVHFTGLWQISIA